MELVSFSHQQPQPPPLWFVTNGETTVGPVRSELLVRGVRYGRVPSDCQIRELRWRSFRSLDQIRELRALIKPAAPESNDIASKLALATDPGEALLFALQLAVSRTGSSFGYVHRIKEAWLPPVTVCAHGPMLAERLGRRISPIDLMLGAARSRFIVIGGPRDTRVHKDAAARLSRGLFVLRGIAMLPIVLDRGLVAMIELGRSDHRYRREDDAELYNIARATIKRLRAFES
jgi:hypothetical protein